MSYVNSGSAVTLPTPPPLPTHGGGPGTPVQSPVQVAVSAGGAYGAPQTPVQSPMQVPTTPAAVGAASGGGQLAQPTATPPVTAAAPAPAAVPAAAPPVAGAQPAAPVAGGGAAGLDPNALLPVITGVVNVTTQVVTLVAGQLQAQQAAAIQAQQQAAAQAQQQAAAQAQQQAAATQGGGAAAGSVAGANGDTAPGGATTAGGPVDVQAIVPVLTEMVGVLNQLVDVISGQAQGQAGAAGVQGGGGSAPAGCGCSHGAAKGAGEAVQQSTGAATPKSDATAAKQPAQTSGGGAAAGNGKLDRDDLTVKTKKMSAEQKRLTETVLQVGKEMGANRKVLETAVMTMIQESTIRNDSSVDSKDHDSLGLFQQRPSAGWGTREQISDPRYAARKFFEKAIPNDKKDPDKERTLLAQSVQISAFPRAYAQWESEAEQIVADFLG